jgi:predicted nucleotidyltransferase
VQVEAYMFGSVPLKTYLPDGDIDLAVFQGKGPKLRDSWTTELSTLLEGEGRNSSSLFRIKDVHVINAEVKVPPLYLPLHALSSCFSILRLAALIPWSTSKLINDVLWG